ncbi:MAG: hypothetical protein JSW39_13750, partial [Desulfobacterales bacterium]
IRFSYFLHERPPWVLLGKVNQSSFSQRKLHDHFVIPAKRRQEPTGRDTENHIPLFLIECAPRNNPCHQQGEGRRNVERVKSARKNPVQGEYEVSAKGWRLQRIKQHPKYCLIDCNYIYFFPITSYVANLIMTVTGKFSALSSGAAPPVVYWCY